MQNVSLDKSLCIAASTSPFIQSIGTNTSLLSSAMEGPAKEDPVERRLPTLLHITLIHFSPQLDKSVADSEREGGCWVNECDWFVNRHNLTSGKISFLLL